VSSHPRYETYPVVCDRTIEDGREAAFWHIIQRDSNTAKARVPDLRRCERIAWPRRIIENSSKPVVSLWQTNRPRKGGSPDVRILLWIEHLDYLVVLAKKKSVAVLVTAYCTDLEHQRKKLRRERDNYLANAKTAP